VNFIVNGNPTDNKEFPWYAHFYASCESPKPNTEISTAECGASLISPSWLVTAGHCTDAEEFKQDMYPYDCDIKKLTENSWIVLGESERQRDGTEYFLKTITHHPNFRKSFLKHEFGEPNMGFDVALLETSKHVRLSEFILPICLPEPNFCIDSETGSQATITGFGKTLNMDVYGKERFEDQWDGRFEGQVSDTRQKVKLPFVGWRMCNKLHQIMMGEELSQNDFCLGLKLGYKDSCQGDSGGPVMVEHEGVHYLYGLVSYGMRRGCGMHAMPSVYARVNSYYDWFNRVIRDSLTLPAGRNPGCMEGATPDGYVSDDFTGESEDWLKWSRQEIEHIYEWVVELEDRHPGIMERADHMYRPAFLQAVMLIRDSEVEFANLFCEYERLRNEEMEDESSYFPEGRDKPTHFFCGNEGGLKE
jgi:secreted trypsin-like serine protease